MPQPSIDDTQPEMAKLHVQLMRDTPGWKKANMLGQMYMSMKQLALSGLHERHPNESDERIHRRLADLLLGAEIAEQFFGRVSESDR